MPHVPRPHNARRSLGVTIFVASTFTAGGCDLIDALDGDNTLIHVFATHHATPEDGVFPNRGGDGKPRIFLNDEGWEITLTHTFVTTVGVSLMDCDGSTRPMELTWGLLPENIQTADLELEGLGSSYVPPSEYCGLTVAYGPYDRAKAMDAPSEPHKPPPTEILDDATVYIRGGADRNGEHITFEYSVAGHVEVDMDLSQIDDGLPLKVRQREPFPLDLTVSKTYDRFFDGIDFTDPGALQILHDQTLLVLEDETRVSLGVTPSVQ